LQKFVAEWGPVAGVFLPSFILSKKPLAAAPDLRRWQSAVHVRGMAPVDVEIYLSCGSGETAPSTDTITVEALCLLPSSAGCLT